MELNVRGMFLCSAVPDPGRLIARARVGFLRFWSRLWFSSRWGLPARAQDAPKVELFMDANTYMYPTRSTNAVPFGVDGADVGLSFFFDPAPMMAGRGRYSVPLGQ